MLPIYGFHGLSTLFYCNLALSVPNPQFTGRRASIQNREGPVSPVMLRYEGDGAAQLSFIEDKNIIFVRQADQEVHAGSATVHHVQAFCLWNGGDNVVSSHSPKIAIPCPNYFRTVRS